MFRRAGLAVAVVLAATVIGYVGWHSRPYVVTGFELHTVGSAAFWRVEYRRPLGGRSTFETRYGSDCAKGISIGYSIPGRCW